MLSLPASQLSRIHILSRRPVPLAEQDPRVNLIIHSDFAAYSSSVLEQLKDAKGVVWALGVSQNDVSKEDYFRITHDFPHAFLDALLPVASQPFNFVYVSGEGATTSPTFMTAQYGRVKGQIEASLLALSRNNSKLRIYSARPAVVDASQHAEILPYIPQRSLLLRSADTVISPVLRSAWPVMMSPTRNLGQALVALATGDGDPKEGKGVSGEGRTLGNVALRRMGGL